MNLENIQLKASLSDYSSKVIDLTVELTKAKKLILDFQATLITKTTELTKVNESYEILGKKLIGYCKESVTLNKYLYDNLNSCLLHYENVLDNDTLDPREYIASLNYIRQAIDACVTTLQPHIDATTQLVT
jgi:hypothetical protein